MLTRFHVITAWLTLYSVAAYPVFAVAEEQRAKAAKIHTYQDWSVRCVGDGDGSTCDMVFQSVDKGTGLQVLAISVAYRKPNYVVRIGVPLGINLQTPVILNSDHIEPLNLAVQWCDRAGCIIDTRLTEDVIEGFAGATQGQITAHTMDERPVTLTFSLSGFREAKEQLVALSE